MLLLVHVTHGHLVTAPIVLALFAIYLRWAGPALGRAKDNHRPCRALHRTTVARVSPDLPDLAHHRVQDRGELLVDSLRITSLNEVRLVTHPLEELPQFILRDAGEEAWVGDLVPIQVKDWEHAPVAGRVNEFVTVPTGSERSSFRLAV